MPNDLTFAKLQALLEALPPRPARSALVGELCVRPGPDQRSVCESLQLDPLRGAIGDRWERKTWMYLPDGKPDPRVQVAICNTTILHLIQHATQEHHHPGDTLFTSLDLSANNLPVGTRLRVGLAVIEVSDVENDACAKFATHYGQEVLDWIRHPQNRSLRLRGLFARVVQGGLVRRGDVIAKI